MLKEIAVLQCIPNETDVWHTNNAVAHARKKASDVSLSPGRYDMQYRIAKESSHSNAPFTRLIG